MRRFRKKGSDAQPFIRAHRRLSRLYWGRTSSSAPLFTIPGNRSHGSILGRPCQGRHGCMGQQGRLPRDGPVITQLELDHIQPTAVAFPV